MLKLNSWLEVESMAAAGVCMSAADLYGTTRDGFISTVTCSADAAARTGSSSARVKRTMKISILVHCECR